MQPQNEASGPICEPENSTYGEYKGGQEYAPQQNETFYKQPPREGSGGKIYADNRNGLRLLWFVVAMVALLAFAVVCLIFVGGTAGWISFCAASFTVMVIASTAISMIK